jgi:hypothetical protein
MDSRGDRQSAIVSIWESSVLPVALLIFSALPINICVYITGFGWDQLASCSRATERSREIPHTNSVGIRAEHPNIDMNQSIRSTAAHN